MKEFHDSPLAGHPGVKRMKKLMENVFTGKEMEEDIRKYVEGCQGCQRNKPDRKKRVAPLHPLPIAMHLWERISVDLIGPLPESNGYDTIMVIVDYFTKMKISSQPPPNYRQKEQQNYSRIMPLSGLEYRKE